MSVTKRKIMRVFKNSILKKIWIVSAISCVILYISVLIISGADSLYILMTPLFLPVFIISVGSFAFINWKKALIGLFAPIPIISYMIECFKGIFHAFRSLVALFKKNESRYKIYTKN